MIEKQRQQDPIHPLLRDVKAHVESKGEVGALVLGTAEGYHPLAPSMSTSYRARDSRHTHLIAHITFSALDADPWPFTCSALDVVRG